MFKKKYFSVNNDFRSGILCRLAVYLGIIFLTIFFILKIISIFGQEEASIIGQIYSLSQSTYPNSFFAFSLIFFAVGVIFYFFNCQFSKLAKIAEEIENSEEFLEEESK
jgi:amino acid transporter